MAREDAVARREFQGWRSESGQAVVLASVFMVVLLGVAGLVVDVSLWYQTQRHDQAVVDAAALAGVQALPEDSTQAVDLAVQYAAKNGLTLPRSAVTVGSSGGRPNTVQVAASLPAPTFFSRIFNITSVTVKANAAAQTDVPGAARYVAPIVVPTSNPQLACTPPPCAGLTQIDLGNLHGPGSGDGAGSFALLDLMQSETGTASAGELADWMLDGYQDDMPLGTYFAAPSTKYDSAAFQSALAARVGDDVLFPVYQPPILAGGSNGRFNIIGWVGFHINSESADGSSGTLHGYFTRYIAQGLQPSALSPGSQDFGVHVIWLTQ